MSLAHVPVSALITVAPPAPTLQDNLTAWGTIFLAAGTFAVVIVAVWTTRADKARARTEQSDRALAQARLVITSTPGTGESASGSNGHQHELKFDLTNHSDRPVMSVEIEAWAGPDPLDQPRRWGANERIVLPGSSLSPVLKVPSDSPLLRLRAWRYRWTDADGRDWCVDQPQQTAPLPFEGQEPRRYGG
jgi:hypothetical protein